MNRKTMDNAAIVGLISTFITTGGIVIGGVLAYRQVMRKLALVDQPGAAAGARKEDAEATKIYGEAWQTFFDTQLKAWETERAYLRQQIADEREEARKDIADLHLRIDGTNAEYAKIQGQMVISEKALALAEKTIERLQSEKAVDKQTILEQRVDINRLQGQVDTLLAEKRTRELGQK